MQAIAAQKKEEEKISKGDGASSSAPKVVVKGAPKRKANGKDDRPYKKATLTPCRKLPKKPSPPKASHGQEKG